jgi:predicted GIY-YIG superfamily endonuclease
MVTNNNIKTHYVYELINNSYTVEYVGHTYRPKHRFYQHTKLKSSSGHGKFYGRQDLIMNIVKTFDNKKDARLFEGELKLSYGMEWTEKTGSINGGKINALVNGKKVIATRLDDNTTTEYSSWKQCARDMNFNQHMIWRVLKGYRNKHKGYSFNYKHNR